MQLVQAGQVLVDGAVPRSAATLVAPSQALRIAGPPPAFVSRGGTKLAHALDYWGIDPAGRRALDVGASTGGFTDCLCQRGAAVVVAVDSGHGQLHPRLRTDPRVRCLERTNARFLLSEHPELAGWAELVVADVSFISLGLLAPVLTAASSADGDLVLLVKPQFEVGRAVAGRGRGVVRDVEERLRAVRAVASAVAEAGADVLGAVPSPLLGPAGNAEVFLHARRCRCGRGARVADEELRAAVAATPDLAAP